MDLGYYETSAALANGGGRGRRRAGQIRKIKEILEANGSRSAFVFEWKKRIGPDTVTDFPLHRRWRIECNRVLMRHQPENTRGDGKHEETRDGRWNFTTKSGIVARWKYRYSVHIYGPWAKFECTEQRRNRDTNSPYARECRLLNLIINRLVLDRRLSSFFTGGFYDSAWVEFPVLNRRRSSFPANSTPGCMNFRISRAHDTWVHAGRRKLQLLVHHFWKKNKKNITRIKRHFKNIWNTFAMTFKIWSISWRFVLSLTPILDFHFYLLIANTLQYFEVC